MESRPPDRAPARSLFVLRDVNLEYGATRVLKKVNLAINPGEIHALVGEHGAGKSSLCFLLSGRIRPTSGTLLVDGHPTNGLTLRRARSLGVGMVSQNNPLFDNMSIADNIYVSTDGLPPHMWFSRNGHLEDTRRLLERYHFSFSPETILGNLDPSDRCLIGILKHISRNPRLIILDEALDKLKVEYFDRIIDILNQLKSEGASVLFVTHRIDDIYQIADRVTIIRGGEIYVSDSVKNIDKINLIKLAYTQISKHAKHNATRQEFYQLLKYNEAILQNLPVNLIVTDSARRVRMINESSKRYFKREEADPYNLPLWSLFGAQNAAIFALLEEKLKADKTDTLFDVPLCVGDETRRNNITVQPVYDGAFRIGSMVMIDDITEQEKLREQMVVSEKLASLGLLAAGVAHEINNPLEAIHNFSEYLKFKIPDEHVAEILSSIDEEVVSISHIVANLISFSDNGTEGGEVFELNDLIEHLVGLVRFDSKYRKITLTFQRSAEALRLRARQSEIKQVVLNLLKNSFDAMPDGGRIWIATRLRRDEVPRIEITFQDSGTGIHGKSISDVFLPFYSTKGAREHMGLGLSISYGIIKKNGGEISASNMAKGCMFRIVLPFAGGEAL